MQRRIDLSKIRTDVVKSQHVDEIVRAASLYVSRCAAPDAWTWFVSPERRKRLERILRIIEQLVEDEADDPGFIATQVTEYCPSSDAMELIDAMCDVERLKQADKYLRRFIAAQIETGGAPRNEFRDQLWEQIAIQYENATGKAAAVTTDPIDNSLSGPFLDLVQSVHRAIGEDPPPSGHAVRSWLKRRRREERGSKPHPMQA